MQFKTLILAALASTAMSQNLTSVLTSDPSLSNLTQYLGLLPDLSATLGQLQNITVLAPNNDAFAEFLNSSAAGAVTETGLIQGIFTYHVLNGSYSNFSDMPEFIPTALQPPTFANVTGGQVVEAVNSSGTVSFYSGLLQNSTVVSSTNFSGGIIHVIDRLLTLPQNVSTTAVQLNLTSAVGALTAANLAGAVDSMQDVTIFVPDNEAFQAIGSALPNLTMEEITSILTYHVINGTVAYSTDLSNTTIPTMQGTNVTITVIGGDVFVNSALVIIPDVLVANGVVHVIDNVLNPGNATATAAGGSETGAPAFSGASSASDVPYTSGVPTPSSSLATESAAATATASSSSSALAPRVTAGAVGAAALFGGAALVMNM